MKKAAKFLLAFLLAAAMLISPLQAFAADFTEDFLQKAQQAGAVEGSELYSRSAVLVNLDTGETVFSYGADDAMEPASVTKIIVALLLMENVPDLNTQITAPAYALDLLGGTNSSLAGVLRGETLTAEQLLYCLMIPSGNDAAMVIADYLGGGVQGEAIPKFVEMMNQRAQELGCTNTHFVNPHGLHDPQHYTTANDMARIVQYILSSPYADLFMKVCKTTRYTIPADNVRKTATTLATTNYMQDSVSGGSYYYKYVEGIKTGSTEEAGYCLVTTAYNASKKARYLCVSFGAPLRDEEGKRMKNGAMLDAKALYDWAFSTLSYKTLVTSSAAVKQITLNFAWNQDTLLLVPESDFATMVPTEIDAASVLITPNGDVPESVDAPVNKGDVMGTATVSYGYGENRIVLGTINLVSDESVESSQLLILLDKAETILRSKWIKIGLAVLVVLLVIYIAVSIVYNIKKKKLQRKNQNKHSGNYKKYG
ncbi:MAG: serine hydrolase [Firmicutes bacterium]|nr:serine hydrolase [Bacillota bacterium]